MRVRLRNKEIDRIPFLYGEADKHIVHEVPYTIIDKTKSSTKVPTDTKLFYITIGLLSGDIILQLVQLALKLL